MLLNTIVIIYIIYFFIIKLYFVKIDCDGRADIIFAMDVSGSIRRERFPMIQTFVQGIVDQFEVSRGKTRVGVATWSDDARVEFQLDELELKQDVLSVCV